MSPKYIHFTDEQKERANNIDLEQFLLSKGERLENSGKDKRLCSDHSVTIRGNTWFDHANEKGGYAIDFVKVFYGLDFPGAMTELIGESGRELNRQTYEKKIEPPKKFALPPKNVSMNRVFAYMTKHRGIDPAVLSAFVNKGLIFESKEMSKITGNAHHNVIFVGRDSGGGPAHAHKRSINSDGKRFMQNVEGSNPHHSFHYLGGSDRLYVFEAPIDLLSFISLHKETNWRSHNYIALCGTSSMPLMTRLEDENIHRVVLCLDNDKAGHETCERFKDLLADRAVEVSRTVPQGKDFNEELLLRQIGYTQDLTMN